MAIRLREPIAEMCASVPRADWARDNHRAGQTPARERENRNDEKYEYESEHRAIKLVKNGAPPSRGNQFAARDGG